MKNQTERKASTPSALFDGPVLECGDVVKLKEPYEASGANESKEANKRFTHGVVAEIVSKQRVRSLDSMRKTVPRVVSLFLFDGDSGQLYLGSGPIGDAGVPTFVDFHIGELTLLQKHDEKYSIRHEAVAGGH